MCCAYHRVKDSLQTTGARKGVTYKTRFRCSIEDDQRHLIRKSPYMRRNQKPSHVCHTSLVIASMTQEQKNQYLVTIRLSTPHRRSESDRDHSVYSSHPLIDTSDVEESIGAADEGASTFGENSSAQLEVFDDEGSSTPAPDVSMVELKVSESGESDAEIPALLYPEDYAVS